MQSKPYDVVLLPETKLINGSVKLSNTLSTFGVHFTLDNETFFPHISLYMLQLNDLGLEQSFNLLSEIAKTSKAVRATTLDYHYENNYLDIEYHKSQELISMQEKVLNKLNSIRDGMREKDKIRLADSAGETRENLLKYGYRSIGNMFNPHLTFTRFFQNQNDILKSLPPKENLDGQFNAIGIFEMGDNGTCVKQVKVWKLQDL